MKRIYIVDDNTAMQQFLSYRLKDYYELHAFEDAAVAYEQLRNQTELPDLMIVDLGLPGMSGLEFIKMVKRSPMLQNIPIMVLSGTEKSDDRIETLSSGADYFLSKPFHPREFDLLVNKFIAIHQLTA